MTVAGNPGLGLLIFAYFFIFQSILCLFAWKFRDKRETLLNFNLLIGFFPIKYSLEMLYDRHQREVLLWDSYDLIFTFFCICAALNIFFWMFSFLSRLNLLKIRWYFFAYINVIGGWIFSILI